MEWYHVWWPWLTSKCVTRFVSDSRVSCLESYVYNGVSQFLKRVKIQSPMTDVDRANKSMTTKCKAFIHCLIRIDSNRRAQTSAKSAEPALSTKSIQHCPCTAIAKKTNSFKNSRRPISIVIRITTIICCYSPTSHPSKDFIIIIVILFIPFT